MPEKPLDVFTIFQEQSFSDAMRKIDQNTEGAVFVINEHSQVIGCLTDGDIRRYLVSGTETKKVSLEDQVANCFNHSFISVHVDTDRESILKLLDHKIRIIPVLNANKVLVDVVSRKAYPLKLNRKNCAQSKSPVRVSFGGGGSDLTDYFYHHGGVVLNSTVNIFSHATLRKRSDTKISVYSYDLKNGFEIESLADLHKVNELPLITNLIRLIKPEFGFDLEITSEFPVGSGLGGSAVVLSAVIGCFNQFNEDPWDRYQIAEMAFQAERLFMDVAGGWQDQYATVFGGFNFMEFNSDSNVIHPLRVPEEFILELEESILLCFSGYSHDSGKIQSATKSNMSNKLSKDVMQKLLEENKRLTNDMKSALLRGKIKDLGICLNEAWGLKKQFSGEISNSGLDEIYNFALSNGAVGGKLLGAGGGGFFLFICNPFQKASLKSQLKQELGLDSQNISFEHKGLQACRFKEY